MSSLDSFGLSKSGLSLPRQSDFTAALQQQWQAAFGAQVNLDPRSNNGQLINIMAERFALLAELLEGIYQASYPSGAEGVAVDNLLALQGLKRLPAAATRTAPSPVVQDNGVTLYGLVCYGDPGTVVPAGSLVADNASPAHSFATDADISIGAAQNAVQTIVFSPAPTSGSYALTLTAPSGATLTTPAIPYNLPSRSVFVTWPKTARDNTVVDFTISIGGSAPQTTQVIQNLLLGSDLADLINFLGGLTTVTGYGRQDTGITLDFGTSAVPVLAFTGDVPSNPVVYGLQGVLNTLTADSGKTYPFADVGVTQQGNVTSLAFGSLTAPKGQPTTAATAVPLVRVTKNLLFAGTTQTNASVLGTVAGQPAQGVGSATCTQTGPATVLAGALTAIQTPVAGWNSVTNQLDCITGSDAETDAEALARRSSLVASQAQGPLAAILQRVRQVSGVTAAIAVSNSSMASQQIVTVGAGATSGRFTLTVQGQTTPALPYNVTAGAMQTALRSLSGLETAAVSGTATSGLAIDWGTSVGGQAVGLAEVGSNTTGVVVGVQFGRYPKSLEVVVQGGGDTEVAQAIFASAPAGLATYGRPVLLTTATTTAGSANVTVADTTGLTVGLGVQCLGVPPGATITSLAENSVTLSAAALSSYSNVSASFGYTLGVADSSGNLQLVGFSRPQLVPIFVRALLTVDTYNVPADASSGVNPSSQWSAASVPAIQAAIRNAIAAVPIGGTIVATGSGGVTNSFRDIAPGIEDAVVYFGTTQDTQNQGRIALSAEQVPDIQVGNILVDTQ